MSTDAVEMSTKAAEEIRALLGRRGINKSELARRLEVSHTWVTNRLTGDQEIGLNELQRIARVLGVKVRDLLPQGDTETFPAGRVTHRPVRPVRPSPTNSVSRRPRDRRPPGRPTASTRPDGSRRPVRIG